MIRLLLWALATILGAAAPAGAQFPIFDAHIHYSRPDWDTYTPERALSILAAAGVRRAIVSSTPDDGTLKLYEKAPQMIVPFLRPYRTRDDMGSWHSDPGVQSYVEEFFAGNPRHGGRITICTEAACGPHSRFAVLACTSNTYLPGGRLV